MHYLKRLKKFRSKIINPFICLVDCDLILLHIFVKRLLRESEISKSYESICDFRSRGNANMNMSY